MEQVEQRKIIKTSEAANILQVKVSTIHKYVKEGKLKPLYEDDWQIDTTKLFYEDDILNFKKTLIKPGLTTGEAAELLGIHITTVSQYIHKGIIRAVRQHYKGRELYFIEPAELERVKSELSLQKRENQKSFIDRDHNIAWFQSFQNEDTGEFGRILLNDENEPLLLTNQNRQITYDDIKRLGFRPLYKLADSKYINKKGYALFQFPYDKNLGSPAFKLFDLFYKLAGPKNMKVNVINQNIIVEIKPVLLPVIEDKTLINTLKSNLQNGDIHLRHNGIYIDSEVETITFSLPAELKQYIKNDAEKLKMTMEEFVLEIVKEKYRENE